MKTKKTPRANLKQWSSLFFLFGLALMLFLSWQALEWKSTETQHENQKLAFQDVEEEEIPVVLLKEPPPPEEKIIKPKVADKVNVFEDKENIKEDLIKDLELEQEDKIVPIEEIDEVELDNVIDDVPFAVIENVPVYPGCENKLSNEARKQCMSEKVKKFVMRKFDAELANDLGLTGTQRIYVQFKIDKSGKITGVNARAPHPKLKQEAIKTIESLPLMTPGKQRGKAVGVMYSLPIIYQVAHK